MFPSTNSRSPPSQGGNIGANPFGNKARVHSWAVHLLSLGEGKPSPSFN